MKPLDILLVEDNIDNRVLFQAYLKGSPHRIQIAENGEEAVTAVREKKFDIIFMDIQMPVLDGLGATKKIREWEKNAKSNQATPIYALTAQAMKSEIENTRAVGCNGHITKPVKKKEVIDMVQKHSSLVHDRGLRTPSVKE